MERREEKGRQLTANSKIVRHGAGWIVPSQTSSKKYTITLTPEPARCTCPDYQSRQLKCKHIFAVEYLVHCQQQGANVSTAVPLAKKPSGKQVWPAYNKAQKNEPHLFQYLLHELCQGAVEPLQEKGRRRFPFQDILFAAVLRVYSTVSCRRFVDDLEQAKEKGYISLVPAYNTIFKYFERELLKPYFYAFITETSLPLKFIETNFAADSSGFSTSCYRSWNETKWGQVRQSYGDTRYVEIQDWLKVHIMCGVKTNIVTAVEVTKGTAGDSPQFKTLVKATARNFVMNEVSADGAYSSAKNLRLVVNNGAMPYIPFKATATGNDPSIKDGLWKRMYHFYLYNQEWFMQHYHKRSNVEATFSMIKAKFGTHLRSKTWTAQVNEALCKILCHNLCVVIQSMYELGVAPVFWVEE